MEVGAGLAGVGLVEVGAGLAGVGLVEVGGDVVGLHDTREGAQARVREKVRSTQPAGHATLSHADLGVEAGGGGGDAVATSQLPLPLQGEQLPACIARVTHCKSDATAVPAMQPPAAAATLTPLQTWTTLQLLLPLQLFTAQISVPVQVSW